jgi:hypothetical protein
MNQAFYYLERSNKQKLIECWSSKRLPFEAQGWLLEMKQKLQQELASIKGRGYLYANFISNRADFFDVDNVLFHNLGTQTFNELAVKGLCFERLYHRPPKVASSTRYPYYSSYRVIKKNQVLWKKDRVIAKWKSISIPNLNEIPDMNRIWFNMKRGNLNIRSNEEYFNYGLELVIHGPSEHKLNLTSVLKPLIEGVLASLHRHNGALLKEVAKELSEKLRVDTQIISRLLMETKTSVLGERSLILPYQKKLKWYPNDQILSYVNITYKDDLPTNDWEMTGELFGVVCKKVVK